MKIEEIIRSTRRKLIETRELPEISFYWGIDGYNELEKLMYIFNYKMPTKQPLRFMGVDHYWDRRKKGMLFKVEVRHVQYKVYRYNELIK